MPPDTTKGPGTWVRVQADRHERRVLVVLAATLGVMSLVSVAAFRFGDGRLAWAGALVMGVLWVVGNRRIDEAVRWLRGAHSEEAVAEALDALVAEGFTVDHDLVQAGEGNVDHLVSGPTGTFMIETKHRWYPNAALLKARRQAAKLHAELGVWVTPVICIEQRRGQKPYRHDGVWIVCRCDLAEWVKSRPRRARH